MIVARRPSALRFAVSRSNAGSALLEGARRFAAALDARLGCPVDVVIAYDHAALGKMLSSAAAELAWMPPLVHARAAAGGARLLALSQRDGVLGYRCALVVHADSRFRTLSDLVGVRAAWIDRESASGYVVPRQHLAARGVELARAFRGERFYGSGAAALRAVVDGEADFSGFFVRGAHDVASAQREIERTQRVPLRVLDLTERIPPDGIVATGDLEAARVTVVRDALHELHTTAGGKDALQTLLQAERLAPVPDDVTRELRRLAVAG